MLGRSSAEAIAVYVSRLRMATSCVVGSADPLIATPSARVRGEILRGTVAFGGGPTVLSTPPTLRSIHGGKRGLRFSVSQDFQVLDDPGPGRRERYRIQTAAYRYTILDEQERELFAWHWEPEGRGDRPRPHLHVSFVSGLTASIDLPTATGVGESPYPDIDVPGLHVPTGRVLLEDVVRFLIEDLAVRGSDDYDAILRDNVRWFLESRSWEHFDQIADDYGDERPEPRGDRSLREAPAEYQLASDD